MTKPFLPIFKNDAGWLELTLVRLFLAWFALDYFLHYSDLTPFTAAPTAPKGIALYVDLLPLSDPGNLKMLKALMYVALAFFVLGVGTGPAIAAIAAGVTLCQTHLNSYGNIHHGTQAMGIALAFMAVGYLVHFAGDLARGTWRWTVFSRIGPHRLAFNFGLQALVGAYVVAGVSKLVISGFEWFTDLPYIAVDVLKIGHQHLYGEGDPAMLEHAEKIAKIISDHPTLTIIVVGSGLFFELFAFLALINRWWSLAFGLVLFGMHEVIGYLMQLSFPRNEQMLFVFMINGPFLVALLAAWVAKRSGELERLQACCPRLLNGGGEN